MAVIFPFEVQFYKDAGVPVSFVGHPMADLVHVGLSRDQAASSFSLDPGRKTVGLFPGSRRSEIKWLLPTILDSAKLLEQRFPGLQFVLPLASTLKHDDVAPMIRDSGLDIAIVHERIHDLARGCDAVISVSGTVTLEVALVGTPLVIIYKVSPLTFMLAQRLVKVDHIGLCNIVAGERVAQELVQNDASPEKISHEVGRILSDPAYSDGLKQSLSAVRQRLGSGGADSNVAGLVQEMLQRKESVNG